MYLTTDVINFFPLAHWLWLGGNIAGAVLSLISIFITTAGWQKFWAWMLGIFIFVFFAHLLYAYSSAHTLYSNHVDSICSPLADDYDKQKCDKAKSHLIFDQTK